MSNYSKEQAELSDNPFTCLNGTQHDFIPDGGCKVCVTCGFSPCS